MYNPRFPHTLRIRRSNGVNDEGDETFEYAVLDVVDYDEYGFPKRDNEGKFISTKTDSVPFGYRSSARSMRESGAVDVAQIQIATPLFLNPILETDSLELTDWDRTYEARAARKTNTNFGSDIWINDVRN